MRCWVQTAELMTKYTAGVTTISVSANGYVAAAG